jgi:hypothetical protein
MEKSYEWRDDKYWKESDMKISWSIKKKKGSGIKIRIVFALFEQLQLQIFQLDVKSTFLNRELQEEIYIRQPPGYELEKKKKFTDL